MKNAAVIESTANRRVLLSLLVSVVLALFVGGCQSRSPAPGRGASDEADAEVAVRTQLAQRRTIAQVVQGLGSCEALLNATATLAPAVEGRVLEILAKHGDAVKAGQPIVQLDPRVAEANFSEKKLTREGLEASLRLLEGVAPPRRTEGPATGDRRREGRRGKGRVDRAAAAALAPAKGNPRATDVRGEVGLEPGPRPAGEGGNGA